MTSCHVWFAVNVNKLLKQLNPDIFIALWELNCDANLHGCEINLDISYYCTQWRTGRGGAEAPPPAWKIQGKLCFQGKHNLLKNPER